jgi:3-oxoadipate CoA-transferase alpha subunit
MNGKLCSAAEAVADIQDGASIAAHFWGISGTPGYLIRAIVDRGVKDLTLYINNFLPIPAMLREFGFPDPTILLPQLKKLLTAFLGTRVFYGMGGDFLGDRVKSGQLEVEMTTHGVLVDRLHAAAMGHGGFYSPIGINSIVAKGKEKRVINGREYVLEEPIRPDIGLIKAYRADKLGNLVYRGTGRGANPVIAMASKTTIAEVFQVVEVGELDPETIITPGIYVDRIVRIPDDDVTSEKRRDEFAERIRQLAAFRAAATNTPPGGQQ